MASEAQPDSAVASARILGSLNGLSDDELAGIGYEAAHPFLDTPLWREAMQDQSDAHAR
jgi:hypothetical protein